MPLLRLHTNAALGEEKQRSLLASLSKIVAETIGKPEDFVMVVIEPAAVTMSGKQGDAAFVDVRSIGGLGGETPKQLSRKICALLSDSLGIAPQRVYLNFAEVAASNWGWKGSTFG